MNKSVGIKLESKIQLKNVKNDLVKNLIAKKNGYQLLRFREHDIKNNSDLVKQQLMEITSGPT